MSELIFLLGFLRLRFTYLLLKKNLEIGVTKVERVKKGNGIKNKFIGWAHRKSEHFLRVKAKFAVSQGVL